MSVPQPSTVTVNGRPCYLNEFGRLNVKNTFGRSAILMDSYGAVVPLDENGEAPLYPTGSYTISDKAVIGLPSTVESQFEFAELWLRDFKTGTNKDKTPYFSSDLSLRYHSKHIRDTKKVDLCTMKDRVPANPWSTAMSELGAAGWELVTVHSGMTNGAIKSENRVAYFKRSAIPGRSADTPVVKIK